MTLADAPEGRWLTRATASNFPLLTERGGLIVEEWTHDATVSRPDSRVILVQAQRTGKPCFEMGGSLTTVS